MADEGQPTGAPEDEAAWDRGFAAAFGSASPRPGSSVLEKLGIHPDRGGGIHLADPDGDGAPVVKPGAESRGAGSARYQVVGEIARGGVGVVFKGRDVDLGRDVALKVLRGDLADRPEILERFVEEAQVGGQLQHPGIVPVYEIGVQDDGRPFFAMKLVKGKTLTALLGERKDVRTRLRRFLTTLEQVCHTVAYAHARRVVHRDLKPSNVMVGAFGEVLVVDWGFAKVLRAGGIADEERAQVEMSIIETVRSGPGSDTSLPGAVMGTPAYMAPEQARGELDRLDERADVFALGGILCEILTGLPPYPPGEDGQLTRAARADTGPAFERLDVCGADAALVEITKRCLDREPRNRPRHAGEVATEIGEHLAGVEERADAARLEARAAGIRAEADRKRRKLAVALAVVSVLAVATGAGALLWISEKDRDAREAVATEVAAALVVAGERLGIARSADPGDIEAWDAVLSAAESARDLAVQREADPGTQAQTEVFLATATDAARDAREAAAAREADERARVRLMAVRMMRGSDFEEKDVDAAFAEAFRTHGLDVDVSTVNEVVAYVEVSRIRDVLTGALERWARVRHAHAPGDVEGLHRLREAVRRLDADPWRNKVRLLADAGDVTPLRALLEEHDVDALSVTSRWTLAQALDHLGAHQEALDLLSRTLLSTAGAEDLWVAFEAAASMLSLSTPDPKEQQRYLERALAQAPEAYGARYHLAGALRVSDVEAALAELREVYEADAAYGAVKNHLLEGLRNRARQLRDGGAYESAEQACRTILEIDETDAIGLMRLGEILIEKCQVFPERKAPSPEQARIVAEALAVFERAHEVRPGGETQALRGQALYLAGRWEEAIEVLEAVPIGTESRATARVALARVYEFVGDLSAAEETYRELLEHPHHGPGAWQGLKTLYTRMGRHERGLSLAEGQATAPRSLGAFHIAMSLLYVGRPAEAETLLTEQIERHGEDLGPGFHNLLGVALAHQGRSDEARARWTVMLERADAQRERARSLGLPSGAYQHRAGQQLVSALSWLEADHVELELWLAGTARERYPDLFDFLQRKVVALVGTGRVAEAADLCLEKLRGNPYDTALGVLTAAVLRHADDRSQRLGAWKAAVDAEGDAAFPLIRLGLGCWAAGDVEGAVRAFDHLAELKPEAAAPHEHRVHVYMSAGRWAEAETACRVLLERASESPAGTRNLARSLMELGRLEEAQAASLRALAVEDSIRVRCWDALLAFLAHGTEDGLRRARELRLAPPRGLGTNFVFLHFLLFTVGRPEIALALCEDSLSRNPDDVMGKVGLARVLGLAPDLGDRERAVRLLREALDATPDCYSAWQELGSILTRAGQHEEALDAYARVPKLWLKGLQWHACALRAISLWQIGRKDAAREALAEAERKWEFKIRQLLGGDLLQGGATGLDEALFEEARALIR